MQNNLAPVVLFVYNRPSHTGQCLDSLLKNPLADQSILYIYADGPKENSTEEQLAKINEVRKVIRGKKWCKEVHIIESATNKGLANLITDQGASSNFIIDTVTDIVNRHGKIIVLEDDLVLSEYFLNYMNEGLTIYETCSNIYSINGYMFPVKFKELKTVLMPYTSSWGWATWKDRWAVFDYEMNQKKNIADNPFLRQRFNLGDYDYASMLDYDKNHWDIRWYYSVFIRNGLCVFPTQTMVKNTGFDGSGTHHKAESEQDLNILTNIIIPVKIDSEIDLEFYSLYLNYFKDKDEKSIIKRRVKKIKKLFNLS